MPKLNKGRILIYFLFGLNITITVLGFFSLLSSPYTGIRTAIENESVVIKVDRNSPAKLAGLQDRDILLDVENLKIPFFTFSPDPDYVSDRKDYDLIWESLIRLGDVVKLNESVNITVKRGSETLSFSVVPEHFSLFGVIKRTLPVYIVAWSFMITAFLVLRKKSNDISVANFIVGTGVCASFAALASYTVRDLYFPYIAFRILKEANYLGALSSSFAFLHLILVFPRKKKIAERYPWITGGVYLVLLLVLLANYTGLFSNMHLTSYLPISLCLITFVLLLVIDFFREKDVVFRRQIQWVVFGFSAGLLAWLIFTSVPVLFGAPILSEEIALLPSIVIPLSFAFAITRYKLMDIGTIFDYIVIYGMTILILQGIELTFLGVVSPYISAYMGRAPIISVVAVLLIVFLYIPIRNTVKRMTERFFKRGTYDIDREIMRFNMELSLSEERLPFEKYFIFVRNLIGSSGCIVLLNGRQLIYSDSEGTALMGLRLAQNEHVAEYLSKLREQVFGFEIIDEGLALDDSLKGALFVPVSTSKEFYVVIFLEKWNNTPYSKKDRSLIGALSLNLSQLLEVERLRIEKSALEEELRSQKNHILKEMHDGLGSILTHIIVASQVASGSLNKEKDAEKVRNMIEIIHNHSREAMDFMRVGLLLLENPESTVGTIVSGFRHRYRNTLQSYGISAEYFVDKDVESEYLGARENLNCIRSVQEAVNNILKHSGADKIEMHFTKQGNNLNITIKDNGRGFDVVKTGSGSGLRNIKERMSEIKGSFEIKSSIGTGTELLLTIPLKSPVVVMDNRSV